MILISDRTTNDLQRSTQMRFSSETLNEAIKTHTSNVPTIKKQSIYSNIYRNYSNLTRPLINAHRPFLAKIVIYFPLILLACPTFLAIYFPLIINAQPNLR